MGSTFVSEKGLVLVVGLFLVAVCLLLSSSISVAVFVQPQMPTAVRGRDMRSSPIG